jgi:hypothetical protein
MDSDKSVQKCNHYQKHDVDHAIVHPTQKNSAMLSFCILDLK